MPTWTLKADRRKADYSQIVARLRSMQDSVEGLTISIIDRHRFELTSDKGNFRDFSPLVRISHDKLAALEIIAEELLLEFGWLIDFAPTSEASDDA